ncbi:MAG: hypothetical protein ABI718_07605 [Acidobacteriota bacterium]
MEKHVTILGIIYIAFGVLFLLAAAIVFVAVAGGGLISGDREAIAITSAVATVVSAFLVLFALPTMAAGIGVMRHRPWARVLALIIGVLNLLNIPFGTILGIYTIWVLMNDDTARIFGAAIPQTSVVTATV